MEDGNTISKVYAVLTGRDLAHLFLMGDLYFFTHYILHDFHVATY
jgi:hypothetical protein